MDGWWGFVGVLVGSVITGIVTIGGQWLRGKQDADLDGMKRTDDRRIERDRIQRDTLLELQQVMGAWLRVQSTSSISRSKASALLASSGPFRMRSTKQCRRLINGSHS